MEKRGLERSWERGEGGTQEQRARSRCTYQGFIQPLLVAAVEFISLPGSIHRVVQGLTEVHEASLVLGQLVPNACGQ